tara:strand:- start:338 stop:454 length:117 start_codon:yes stop_codon:yes gene_type:complete
MQKLILPFEASIKRKPLCFSRLSQNREVRFDSDNIERG